MSHETATTEAVLLLDRQVVVVLYPITCCIRIARDTTVSTDIYARLHGRVPRAAQLSSYVDNA